MKKAFNIRNVYKSDSELKELISRVERDLHDAKMYNTSDSKVKVKRLSEFLNDLKGGI